jgi:hypothetical protein
MEDFVVPPSTKATFGIAASDDHPAIDNVGVGPRPILGEYGLLRAAENDDRAEIVIKLTIVDVLNPTTIVDPIHQPFGIKLGSIRHSDLS